MKRLLRAGLVLMALMTAKAPALAADAYIIDPMHTSVVWTINHFGFSHPWGKFSMVSGVLNLDEQNPTKSVVKVSIPMTSIVTGVEKLDAHLKTKDFFDVDNYPEATFVSNKVLLEDEKNTARVEGVLTLRGVSKPATLFVVLNKIGMNMFNKKTAGFSATATIRRSDFGIKNYLPAVGDEVTLHIEAEANL